MEKQKSPDVIREQLFIKYSGDAKLGIFRSDQNTVEFNSLSGIAVLIDKNILPCLENGKVYSVTNPKFRILDRCVILEGFFGLVVESDCEQSRQYSYPCITYPVREVNVRYDVSLTDKVKLNSLNKVVEITTYGRETIKEALEYEESHLPIEYQWMLEKLKKEEKIFKINDGYSYLSQDENLEIIDARIVGDRAEYEIKTNHPIYLVCYGIHKDVWQGQKPYHLYLYSTINPENGVLKVVTRFQDDEPKESDSILTDGYRHVDDGEFRSGWSNAMSRWSREHGSSSMSRGRFSDEKKTLNINRCGNVAIVEFWGKRYAVVFDGEHIDHVVTIDNDEMDSMIHDREERIKRETLELYCQRLSLAIEGEISLSKFSEYFAKSSEAKAFMDDFRFNFPAGFQSELTDLYKQLKYFGVETVKKFQNASSIEKLDELKSSYFIFIKKMEDTYKKGESLISAFSKFFEEILKETQVAFVNDNVHEIFNEISALESIACDGDLEKLSQAIYDLKQRAKNLPNLSISKKENMEEKEMKARKNLLAQAGKLGVPENLLNIFGDNIESAIQFMSNVSKIETSRLDQNELSCGRARASTTIENAWYGMGETTNFFCGADPNDVKYYVYEHHFGEDASPVERHEEKGSFSNKLSTSNDAMSEALRKAGLI